VPYVSVSAMRELDPEVELQLLADSRPMPVAHLSIPCYLSSSRRTDLRGVSCTVKSRRLHRAHSREQNSSSA